MGIASMADSAVFHGSLMVESLGSSSFGRLGQRDWLVISGLGSSEHSGQLGAVDMFCVYDKYSISCFKSYMIL